MKKSTLPTGFSCGDYLGMECGVSLWRLYWKQDLYDLSEYARVSSEEDALLRDVFCKRQISARVY